MNFHTQLHFSVFLWLFDGPISLKAQHLVKKHRLSVIYSKMSTVIIDRTVSHIGLNPHPLAILFTYRVVYIQAGPITNLVA